VSISLSPSLRFLLGVSSYTDVSSAGLGEKQTRANWLFGIQNILVYIDNINGHAQAKKERHLDYFGGAHKYLQRITSPYTNR